MQCVAFQGASERFPPIGLGTDDIRERAQWRSICKRYKKGRHWWWTLGEREVGSSGGFAPRPPRFNALVPVRNSGKRGLGPFAGPASVPAPGSALGLLLSRSLSSAQAEGIVAEE